MFTKLSRNQRGFGLHVVLPVLAVLVVGAIGAYMQFSSSASVPPEGWTTIKNASGYTTISPNYRITFNGELYTSTSSKYRICVVAKFASGTRNVLSASWTTSGGSTINEQNLATVGTSYVTRCSSGYYGRGYVSPAIKNKSNNKLYISSVYWQKYY